MSRNFNSLPMNLDRNFSYQILQLCKRPLQSKLLPVGPLLGQRWVQRRDFSPEYNQGVEKEQVGPFVSWFIDSGRHQLYNNGSLVPFSTAWIYSVAVKSSMKQNNSLFFNSSQRCYFPNIIFLHLKVSFSKMYQKICIIVYWWDPWIECHLIM